MGEQTDMEISGDSGGSYDLVQDVVEDQQQYRLVLSSAQRLELGEAGTFGTPAAATSMLDVPAQHEHISNTDNFSPQQAADIAAQEQDGARVDRAELEHQSWISTTSSRRSTDMESSSAQQQQQQQQPAGSDYDGENAGVSSQYGHEDDEMEGESGERVVRVVRPSRKRMTWRDAKVGTWHADSPDSAEPSGEGSNRTVGRKRCGKAGGNEEEDNDKGCKSEMRNSREARGMHNSEAAASTGKAALRNECSTAGCLDSRVSGSNHSSVEGSSAHNASSTGDCPLSWSARHDALHTRAGRASREAQGTLMREEASFSHSSSDDCDASCSVQAHAQQGSEGGEVPGGIVDEASVVSQGPTHDSLKDGEDSEDVQRTDEMMFLGVSVNVPK
jgi:hypothetical protein